MNKVNGKTGIWKICTLCEGNGSHSQRFGAMTWEQFFINFADQIEQKMYFEGTFDVQCENCNGSGKTFETSPYSKCVAKKNVDCDCKKCRYNKIKLSRFEKAERNAGA